MSTYFLSLNVSPTQDNAQYAMVRGALAHCWIVEDNPEDAFSKASFYVAKYDWSVESIETYPVETTRQDFAERDLGLENYDKAQRHGIAVVFLGWARDGKTTSGPTELEPSHTIDINGFLKTLKYFKNRGRCLHFDSKGRCQEIVHAHSIQREKALSPISCDGHVYRLTPVIGDPKNSKDRLSCERIGINRVSTFLGFCKRHDNQLFAEIDKHLLIPTDEQVFLYAYRSLCRELFVKENSLNILESQLNKGPIQKAIRDLLSDVRRGTAFGLSNLGDVGSYDALFLTGGGYICGITPCQDRPISICQAPCITSWCGESTSRIGRSITHIIREECEKMRISPEELKRGGRRVRVSEAKAAIACRGKEELGVSDAEIARLLGVNTSSINLAIARVERGEEN